MTDVNHEGHEAHEEIFFKYQSCLAALAFKKELSVFFVSSVVGVRDQDGVLIMNVAM